MKLSLIILILFPAFLFGQDITGKWTGIITQEPNREFYYEITIEQGEGINVSGTTVIRDNATGNYGIISYEGNFENKMLYFREADILTEDKSKEDGYWKSNTFNWCIKTGLLKFSQTENETKLEGPWASKTGSCAPGKITVIRSEEEEEEPEFNNLNDCLGTPASADFLYGMWTGKMHQYSCNIEGYFDIIILIDKVEGLKFSGAFIWPASSFNSDSRSTLEGEIKDGKIFLYEKDIISGSGLVLDGIYECKMIDCDHMEGFWRLEKYQTNCDQPNVLKNGGDYQLEHYKIPTIYFDHNSSILSQKSMEDLNEFAAFMKKFKNLKIELDGHTDNTGSNARNLVLSQERSKIVRDYLIKKGIPQYRLVSERFGSLSPVESNETTEGKQLNRRTEVKIIKK